MQHYEPVSPSAAGWFVATHLEAFGDLVSLPRLVDDPRNGETSVHGLRRFVANLKRSQESGTTAEKRGEHVKEN